MPEAVLFEKEMAIGHRDFLRLLSRALEGAALVVSGDTITLEERDRTLEITLSPETERRIGSLSLPVITARFSYTGYGDPAKHLALLERSFQRGGG